MFNVSPIQHTVHIKSKGEFIPNFFTVPEVIFATAASILCLKSGKGYDGRAHPPQCTTSLENRLIVRMEVRDRSVISPTVAQHIESVTHHSVSACTIRRRLQQSGPSTRRPFLGLPLTQSHKRLLHQQCDERRMRLAEWNEVVFTDESRICQQHHNGRIRVWRHHEESMLNRCVMHNPTGLAPGIMV
ncbi:transposable element Tcb1 transposase [Trichonephila clavipes]|uniref:Transposable element Tcb1 transposase n=1 Tax=Trichonephila clavipes TaxID=2585209 RepID=A0A8X7BJ17_TRICX|nr:transposable element Tcb1 transposase [Trichonephila clavipes]